ncbi:DNA methyltransferase [uncultured Clostridium sp.]|uniref:DNA methyltransferase n=1 Tax=uncultured Clostridium sp. TaxID=59620 RepID=UPI0028EE4C1F|nr:DNA methyltransferase [uncultured Clostridium sp.]
MERRKSTFIDFFGGSGSTLIAATELNRICYTMELDEKYADYVVHDQIDWFEVR